MPDDNRFEGISEALDAADPMDDDRWLEIDADAVMGVGRR